MYDTVTGLEGTDRSCKDYKMVLSEKSETSFFTTNTHEASWIPRVKLGSNILRYEHSPRLLGVYLDRQLSFGKQVEMVTAKVTSKCRMLAALYSATPNGVDARNIS